MEIEKCKMRAEFTNLANGRAQRSGNRLRGSLAGGVTTKDTEATKRTGEGCGGKANDDYKCSNRFRASVLTGDGADVEGWRGRVSRKGAKTQREFGARRGISRRRGDTEIKAADSENSSAAW